MKLENFKQALAEKTNITYELLEEKFDPDYYDGCNTLETLITEMSFASEVIGYFCDWHKTPENKSGVWNSAYRALRRINDATVESLPIISEEED